MIENDLKNNYYNIKAVSASLLKALSNSQFEAKRLLDNVKQESPALSMGSLVDCLLTTPEKFNDTYVIYRGSKPANKMLTFAEEYIRLYNELVDNGIENIDENSLILQARDNIEYDKRLMPHNVIRLFKEQCSDYVEFYNRNRDKIIIDEDVYNKAVSINRSVRNSKYLQFIFDPRENVKVYNQVPIYFNYSPRNNIPIKMMYDCLIVDKKYRTLQIIDYKTYDDNFQNNYYKYKYYYQEVLYEHMLDYLIRNSEYSEVLQYLPECIRDIKDISEYKILKFKFVAISKSPEIQPSIYESYHSILQDVLYRNKIKRGAIYLSIRSIYNLINEYIWREETNDWVSDYYMETNGVKYVHLP